MKCKKCGEIFDLKPSKPGYANLCPECSPPVHKPAIPKPVIKNRRVKSAEEINSDFGRKLKRLEFP